jgi:hypothetical protein
MALYEEFTFKSNGVTLSSMDDFISANTGTQFEKNTGELYTKSVNGVFDKVSRKYFSQIESDAKYIDAAGDTFTGTMIPNANNTLMIGSETVRFNTIFSTTFNGKATDSSKLNGYVNAINTSGTGTANSIAQRDADGKINAAGFNGKATDSALLNGYVNAINTSGTGTANSIAQRDADGKINAAGFNGKATDSSKLNGYSESTTATANSIARRDASGNLTAGTFNGTSTDSSKLNGYSESTTATANSIARRDASGNLTAGTFNGTSTNSGQLNGYTQSVYATANTIALRDAYGNLNAVLLQGTATTARYADLAEKYETDREYSVGTVLEVQGEKEVTLYNGGALAGVISENPGLMINAEGNGQYITLKGKVPVICEGDIYKGQYCLAIPGGKVQGKFKEEITALDVLNIVGVALEDSKNNMVQVKI